MFFGETEFGGLIWFSYVVLILVLLIGYFMLRVQKTRAKKKKRPRLDERTDLERELQAEIDAAAHGHSPAEEEPSALDLPPEERQRMEELRRRAES